MEAKSFASEDDRDIMVTTGTLKWVQMRSKSYQFEYASEASRMEVHFMAGIEVGGSLKATGRNCDQLMKVVMDHLLPSLPFPRVSP